MPKKFKTNQRKNKVVTTSSVNSRYIDKMRREGTPVGSNEWTKRRAIEIAVERAKDTKNNPPGKKPSNW